MCVGGDGLINKRELKAGTILAHIKVVFSPNSHPSHTQTATIDVLPGSSNGELPKLESYNSSTHGATTTQGEIKHTEAGSATTETYGRAHMYGVYESVEVEKLISSVKLTPKEVNVFTKYE